MTMINIEIKARFEKVESVRKILEEKNAVFKGEDHQIDIYFQVPKGRLKLREGNIENNLIFYNRENKEGPKQSDVILFRTEPQSNLKKVLTEALNTLVIVDKEREIHFIDNIKFHIDNVKELGTFIEIEAIDENGTIGKEKLLEQCNEYLKLFKIPKENLISVSYSDLLMRKKKE